MTYGTCSRAVDPHSFRGKINADPCGSRSATLDDTKTYPLSNALLSKDDIAKLDKFPRLQILDSALKYKKIVRFKLHVYKLYRIPGTSITFVQERKL